MQTGLEDEHAHREAQWQRTVDMWQQQSKDLIATVVAKLNLTSQDNEQHTAQLQASNESFEQVSIQSQA